MTLLATGREIRLHVIGVRGAVVILLMATYACCICAGEVVIVVDVTLRALQYSVCSSKRKARVVVVKGGV